MGAAGHQVTGRRSQGQVAGVRPRVKKVTDVRTSESNVIGSRSLGSGKLVRSQMYVTGSENQGSGHGSKVGGPDRVCQVMSQKMFGIQENSPQLISYIRMTMF